MTRSLPVLIALLLLGCYAFLPWQSAPYSALTLNAHDYAEWLSLIPSVRAQPLLLTPLLLRACLMLTSLALALALHQAGIRPWGLRLSIVAGAAAAQLPPFEFFSAAGSGDPNYQQQFALAVVTFLGGGALTSNQAARLERGLPLALYGMSVLAAQAGGLTGAEAARSILPGVAPGAGLAVWCILCLAGAAAAWSQAVNMKKGAQPQTR